MGRVCTGSVGGPARWRGARDRRPRDLRATGGGAGARGGGAHTVPEPDEADAGNPVRGGGTTATSCGDANVVVVGGAARAARPTDLAARRGTSWVTYTHPCSSHPSNVRTPSAGPTHSVPAMAMSRVATFQWAQSWIAAGGVEAGLPALAVQPDFLGVCRIGPLQGQPMLPHIVNDGGGRGQAQGPGQPLVDPGHAPPPLVDSGSNLSGGGFRMLQLPMPLQELASAELGRADAAGADPVERPGEVPQVHVRPQTRHVILADGTSFRTLPRVWGPPNHLGGGVRPGAWLRVPANPRITRSAWQRGCRGRWGLGWPALADPTQDGWWGGCPGWPALAGPTRHTGRRHCLGWPAHAGPARSTHLCRSSRRSPGGS